MKKKIISFLTSAAMALTCLGGGFSDVINKINLLSEPISAEAMVDQLHEEEYSSNFLSSNEPIVTTTPPVTTTTTTTTTTAPVTTSTTTTYTTTSTTVTTSIKELLYTETVYITEAPYETVETATIASYGEQVYFYDDSEFNLDDVLIDVTYRYYHDGGGTMIIYYWSDGSETYETIDGSPTERYYDKQHSLTDFDYKLEYESPAEMYESLGLSGYEEVTIGITLAYFINYYGNSYEFSEEIPITFKPKEVTYTCGSNLTATYTKGVLTISGTGDMYDYGVYTIPWYNESEEIKTVIIEDGVTSIGVCAFYDLVNLENITLPDSIASIGSHAFSGTPVYSNGKKNSVYYIGDWVIKCDETAETVELKEDTVGLAEYAFCLWENLTDITLPDSLVYIDDYAFSGCTGLESITIPNSVKVIGSNAFHGCNKIKEIVIPATVETIEEKAFGYSSSDTLISGYKIYGVTGTAAEEYALKNGITFVDINNSAILSETSLSLTVGESKLLTVKNNSSNVVWTSENPAVATVSSGYVEAVSAGKTIVYAIIGNEVLTCEVTVSENDIVTTTVAVTTTETTVVTTSISIVTSISPITSLYHRAYHLDINNLPNKTNYNIGDELDLTGLKVDLTYNDESNIYHNTDYINVYPLDYPDVFTVDTSKFDNSKAGTYTIEISCKYEYLHWSPPSAYLKVIVSDSGSSATTTTFTSTSSTDITTTETTITTISDVPIITTDISTTTSTSTTVDTDIFDVKEVDGGIIIINCDTLVVNVTVPVDINGVEVIKINDYVFSSSDLKTITFDNPNVIIADSETTINEKTVIFGYKGSTAEAYAEKYDRIFVSLDEGDKPDYVQGDITGDGNINIYDAIDICKYIMGMKKLTEDEETIADFDENGVVDLYDAIGIAKKLLE